MSIMTMEVALNSFLANHPYNHAFTLTQSGRFPQRILVADNDSGIREALSDLLVNEGAEVFEAKNGIEALNFVIDKDPDILVLDNRMPGLTGAQVFQELRRRDIQIPIIMITAAREMDVLVKDLGIRYYLKKPFNLEDLLDVLDRIVRDQKAH